MQPKRPLSTGIRPHLLAPCIFASGYHCRLSVHFVPCCGLAPQCPVVPVCRDNHYIQSSDFLISRIFSIVVLPTLRYLISSSSGIVRKRLTSIISCPFSYRIMFACFSALFAIVKTLSSFMLILIYALLQLRALLYILV